MVTPLPKSNINSFFANPKFKEFASNALTDLGYGLTRGTDLNQGFQLATQRTAEMQPQRDAYATSEAEKAQRLEQLNKTVAYLRTQQGGSTWADAVENGLADPKDAFKGWYEATQKVAENQQPTYGLTPIPGQIGDKFGYGVLGTDGSFKPVATGDFQPLDPRALNIEKAAGTAIGKGQGANELAAPGMEVALDQMDAKTDNVLAKIDEALGQVSWDSSGAIGQAMGALGGTKAYDLRSTATTIKANLGFAELQAMRDASPTGGALGQVAVQELEALQSTLASLDPNQSEGQLKSNLETIKVLLERQKEYRRQAAGAKYGTPAPSGANAPEGVWVYNPATGKLEQQ